MKRTFKELRMLILLNLSKGEQTINQLSQNTGINWRSVKLHLEHLENMRDVVEIVRSAYVRIYRITAQGEKKAGSELHEETIRVRIKRSSILPAKVEIT